MSRTPNLPVDSALTARRTTPDHVADALREGIMSGALADGEELNQVALAEHFKVSRVPIREALRQLQAEGLVRQEAHRRAVVNALSIDHIMELFDVRALLETYMLERAIPHLTGEHLRELQALVRGMRDVEDHRQWLRLNRDFHRTLYEPSGATYAMNLADQIAARTSRYLYLYSGGAGIKRVDDADREHRQILRAVKERDVERACALLREHIEETRAEVKRLYAARGEQQEG